jgi:hypothetical protein
MQDGQSLSLGIRILQEFMELDFLVVLDAGLRRLFPISARPRGN